MSWLSKRQRHKKKILHKPLQGASKYTSKQRSGGTPRSFRNRDIAAYALEKEILKSPELVKQLRDMVTEIGEEKAKLFLRELIKEARPRATKRQK